MAQFIIDKGMKTKIFKYIEDNYREEEIDYSLTQNDDASFRTTPDWAREIVSEQIKQHWRDDIIKYIDSKGITDSEFYHRAHISKQTFNKIKNTSSYTPNKDTAFQICLGLKLNEKESVALLERIGYSFCTSNKRDLLIRGCIINKFYRVTLINDLLYELGYKLFPSAEIPEDEIK